MRRVMLMKWWDLIFLTTIATRANKQKTTYNEPLLFFDHPNYYWIKRKIVNCLEINHKFNGKNISARIKIKYRLIVSIFQCLPKYCASMSWWLWVLGYLFRHTHTQWWSQKIIRRKNNAYDISLVEKLDDLRILASVFSHIFSLYPNDACIYNRLRSNLLVGPFCALIFPYSHSELYFFWWISF